MRATATLLATLALGLGLATPGFAQDKTAKKAGDPAVAAQLKALEYKYEIDEDGDYRLLFDVDDESKRTQLVFVRSNVESYGGHSVREVWSAGYKASGDAFPANVANRLLEASMDSKMGGWGKQGKAAIFIVRVPANAGKDVLDAAITAALNSADEMEQELTGKDDL